MAAWWSETAPPSWKITITAATIEGIARLLLKNSDDSECMRPEELGRDLYPTARDQL